jgi:hypothetical protein
LPFISSSPCFERHERERELKRWKRRGAANKMLGLKHVCRHRDAF